MEEKQELQEWMDRMEESNRQQARYAKWQCIFTAIAAVCCVSLFLLVYIKMPALQELSIKMENVLTDLEVITQQLSGSMETVLENLETVTAQLAEVDLGAMAESVDDLVTTSQAGVEQAMDRLNTIDFKKLNQAIGDLADVVGTLAKVFNVFG
jgi:NTP pyrophosphatase (non-canonical NTP hydrolase)